MAKINKILLTEHDVVCPLFYTEDRATSSLSCEGAFERTRVRLSFPGLLARDRHMALYCCKMDGYEQCPYYQATEKKYQNKPKTKKGTTRT